MQGLRQLGIGVVIAVASVILVLGGIFLSLAETLPASATPTPIPPTLPLSFPTPTPTSTPTTLPQTATATNTETASPSPTTEFLPTVAVSCSPPSDWIRVTTSSGDTVYSLAQRYKTTAESLSAANCLTSFDLPAGLAVYVPPVPTVTVIPCGPPGTWVRGYVVQRGDTLYRVALAYGLTYTQLQRANCMGGSTTIYAGQRLWVPNIPIPPMRTPTPGVTVLPDFPTFTPVPTNTSVPPTEFPTDLPTATNAPPPTQIPAATDTPITPPSQ
jgi:type VI secretion system secreted protein VgrG